MQNSLSPNPVKFFIFPQKAGYNVVPVAGVLTVWVKLVGEFGALKAAAVVSFCERRGLLSLDSGNCSAGMP